MMSIDLYNESTASDAPEPVVLARPEGSRDRVGAVVTTTQNGPVRTVAGQYGQAWLLEEATTNIFTNPVLFSASTGWSSFNTTAGFLVASRVTNQPDMGAAAWRGEITGTTGTLWLRFLTSSVAAGSGARSFTGSFDVKASRSIMCSAVCRVTHSDGSFLESTAPATLGTTVSRFTTLACSSDAAKTVSSISVFLILTGAVQVGDVVWMGRGQVEEKAYATTYTDGSLGTGYAWIGTAHASTSTRAASSLALPLAGTLGSVVVRYREDAGTVHAFRVGAGAFGQWGVIAHSGGTLTISTTRRVDLESLVIYDVAISDSEAGRIVAIAEAWTWENVSPYQSTATPPAPELAPVPEPAPVPDPVVAEQVVYTKPITATQWATLARWTAGMTIPTGVIAAYIRHLGYTTTASVDADIETGVVTIVTTGSVLTDALWAGFAGGSGASKVEVTVAWTAFAESATTAVPGRDTVIGLWFYLERQGIGPITIFRRWDGAAYWLVLTTYGAIPAGVAEAYVYQAPTAGQISRVRVFARNNPPLAGEQFYIALQADAVLEVQTGVDLAGLQTVSDIVPVSLETARAPTQVQEQRQLDVQVMPGYFEQATEPANAREGDIWVNGAVFQKRVQGAWVTIAETTPTIEGTTVVGRLSVPESRNTALFGWFARARGRGSVGIGAYADAAANFAVAIGNVARAGLNSIAIGRGATVPDTSPRSIALGHSAAVPESTSDLAVIQANEVRAVASFVSGGNQQTFLAVISPDGMVRRLGVGNDGRLTVGGVVLNALTSPVPGADSTTDGGYLMGQAISSGSITEILGEILSYAINVPQSGVRDTARVGGIFRLDTRSGAQEFVVFGYPTGGSTATARIRINLQDGRVRLAPAGGNVSIGLSGFGTARLHLPAGAAASGNAPLKLSDGTLLTTPEVGTFEFAAGVLYFTPTGTTRRPVVLDNQLAALKTVTGRANIAASLSNTGATTMTTLTDPTIDITINPAMAHTVTVRFYAFVQMPLGGSIAFSVGNAQNSIFGGVTTPNPIGGTAYMNLTVVHTWEQPAGPTQIQARARWQTATSTGCSLFIGSVLEVEAHPYYV